MSEDRPEREILRIHPDWGRPGTFSYDGWVLVMVMSPGGGSKWVPEEEYDQSRLWEEVVQIETQRHDSVKTRS